MQDSGNRPSPADWEHFEQALLAGTEPYQAARERGLTSSFYRRADPVRHAELLRDSREAREGIANTRGEQWALDDEADPRLKLAYLKANSAAYRQGDQVTVEHGGMVGVGVRIDHDFGGLLDKLERAGLVARGPVAALDAPPVEVLPARPD